MRVAVGSDESTYLTDAVLRSLQDRGHEVIPFGALKTGNDFRWPSVGKAVGEAVATGLCEQGVVLCYTGTGVTIAANKVPGVRAALCGDAQTADGARRWNDANVLALSLRATSAEMAHEILDAWFAAPSPSEEGARLVDIVNAMDPNTRNPTNMHAAP